MKHFRFSEMHIENSFSREFDRIPVRCQLFSCYLARFLLHLTEIQLKLFLIIRKLSNIPPNPETL